MKRLIILLFTACLAISFSSCADRQPTEGSTPPVIESEESYDTVQEPEPQPEPQPESEPEPFPGKIAIITTMPTGDFCYYSAMPIIEKYGSSKVLHRTLPLLYSSDAEEIINIVAELGADIDVKAIVVNPAVMGANLAFEKLRELRKDIYVVYCAPDISYGETQQQAVDRTMQTADLVISSDENNIASSNVRQAQKLGAETFVHYSVQDYWWDSTKLRRRELVKQTCNDLSINFIDVKVPESILGNASAFTEFFRNDIYDRVNKCGKNTAFFCSYSGLDSVFILSAVGAGAIYSQSGYPSYFYGIVEAFYEIEVGLLKHFKTDSIGYVMGKPYLSYSEFLMSKAKPLLAREDMLGRLSAWPVEERFMYTIAAAEYAVKWINGEVPKEGVDVDVLKQLMEDFAGVEVYLTPYTDEYPYTENGTGETYDNFLMMTMDYITFE
ncbi:MAG: DUF3798 domain-containing protein [Clostridiales bacterium]|nr:DUF3798 domain-containing protein [Clostridiales bacterium]